MKQNEQTQIGQRIAQAMRAVVVSVVAAAIMLAAPTVYPTGVTTYEPDHAWNGFTVLTPLGAGAAIVIDMNGNVVKTWDGYANASGGPNRILPGGVVIGSAGSSMKGRLESRSLVERDFDGKELWSFDHNRQIENGDGETIWSLRQHHDWQRADFPAGYYSPNVRPELVGPKMLILTHIDHSQPSVTPEQTFEDDRLIEISPDGDVLWEWVASDHIDEMQFDDAAREAIAVSAAGRAGYDWLHLNAATYVGPNHWYDEGDERFNPENVIISSRQASLVAIVARDGKIVWQIGPNYRDSPEMRKIRQVIGQHHAHIIPQGLPGAGNMMIFDNGGASGYGAPTPVAPKGSNIFTRPTSRVLEINPSTLELVWSYNAPNFFATNISGAQRLANGNTLITEGPDGRIFEVTEDGDIVWEYIYPEYTGRGKTNSVYRAYRVPYDWIPQLDHPSEKAVTPPDKSKFRVP